MVQQLENEKFPDPDGSGDSQPVRDDPKSIPGVGPSDVPPVSPEAIEPVPVGEPPTVETSVPIEEPVGESERIA